MKSPESLPAPRRSGEGEELPLSASCASPGGFPWCCSSAGVLLLFGRAEFSLLKGNRASLFLSFCSCLSFLLFFVELMSLGLLLALLACRYHLFLTSCHCSLVSLRPPLQCDTPPIKWTLCLDFAETNPACSDEMILNTRSTALHCLRFVVFCCL